MNRFLLLSLLLALVAAVACGDDRSKICSDGGSNCGPKLTPPVTRQTVLARMTPAPTLEPVDTSTPRPTSTQSAVPSVEVPTPTVGPPPTGTPLPGAGRTGISGIVLVGPQCPVVREGEECPDKPLEADIDVYDASGAFVTRARSDANGEFFVAVAAGDYRLEPQSPNVLPSASPMDVTVRDGFTTRVVVQYDSGIR